MRPFASNGRVWRVVGVPAGDPRLVDRTGRERLATTDPVTSTVHVVMGLAPPLLDRVMVHEAAHAATMSHGELDAMRAVLPAESWVAVEEWAARMVELHGIEAAAMASESLGRPVCVRGYCNG